MASEANMKVKGYNKLRSIVSKNAKSMIVPAGCLQAELRQPGKPRREPS